MQTVSWKIRTHVTVPIFNDESQDTGAPKKEQKYVFIFFFF